MMGKWLFLTVFIQVLLTFSVMYIMGKRRFAAAKNKQIEMAAFKTMALDNAPEHVIAAGRNFLTQFELPVLFYVAVLMSLQLNLTGWFSVACAGLFVLSRVIHSVIHLGSNDVFKRYKSFVLGAAILLIWWLGMLVQLFVL
ncbi:hypothetical protein PTUN_b0583 [Pseudoalteromonas tunicata]|jgi:hypothetical protein|nr:hypothetical protein PTUN_b0583 [Pseudoalteromonas tunicata]